jgi:RNA polymerase sigma-70 factor, ECF subfamily
MKQSCVYPVNGPVRAQDTSRTDRAGDEHLVERAIKGDSSAFEVLVRQHARSVEFLVHRITKNREDAEDAMQEAFIQAYTHMASFEGRSSFRTWFTTIAVNQALMCLRKRKKHRAYMPDSFGDDQQFSLPEIPDTRPNAEVEIEKRELACLLGSATNRLPHRLRSVFCLRTLDEMSTGEVAKALGLSVPAVKARMSRARSYLRQRVAAHSQKIA